MDPKVNKQELVDWIESLNDPHSLASVKILKESLGSNGDWWNEISEAEKDGITRGLEDVKAGRVISDNAFWKKS